MGKGKNYREFNDPLWKRINESYINFKDQAKTHRKLHRNLWIISSVISVLVAITSAYDFTIWSTELENVSVSLETRHISTFLALILPLVTGYVVLRSPEQLWIHEINYRNQLSDIKTRLEFELERETRDPKFDIRKLEEKYLNIMSESNKAWIGIKQK